MRWIAAIGLTFLGCNGSAESPPVAADATVSLDSGTDASNAPPVAPAGLTHWIVGDPADRVTASTGGIILMGGGTDVDAAFLWQRNRIGGGDVVVLRTSGADGYNDYLFTAIGGVDSVETLRVDTRALADDPYVRWTVEHAEAIFIAGGDQASYVAAWRGTAVAHAIEVAAQHGAVIGGTSAGCAVLGSIVYAASAGSVYSDEALANPYDARVTLVHDMVALPALAGVVTDTHFHARDRMGRLLAFTARAITDGWAAHPIGLGVDEQTALVIDEAGVGTVVGSGSVYALAPVTAPATCSPGTALAWSAVPLFGLAAGAKITLPGGATQATPRALAATAGALQPANPY